MVKSIEVFRDLYLRGPLSKRRELRQALIASAKDPWHFDTERTAAISRGAADADILAFDRGEKDNIPAAGLTLWGREDGYYVPNIVPLGDGELGVARYNAILADFIDIIVRPVAAQFGYEVDATDAHQGLEDWMSPDAARRLRSFSSAANKSTGSSHPLDERRWFDFIISVHESDKVVSADLLMRWLHEVEGWDEDSAHELAGEYETALRLLRRYDER